MPQQIILRKGTATEWTNANPTLAAGEPGFETNTGKFKIGNGTLAWNSLSYTVGTIPVNLADLSDVTSDAPSSGQVLKWNGTAWAPAADAGGVGGAGTVTSVSGTGTVSGLTLTGTVTDSGSLTLGGTLAVTAANFSSQVANTVLAAPDGATGTPTFRTLVANDIPTLNQSTTGTADNVTGIVAVANGGTGLTSPTIFNGPNIEVTGDWPNQVIGTLTDVNFTNTVVSTNLSAGTVITNTVQSVDNNNLKLDVTGGSVFIRPSGTTFFGDSALNRNGTIYQIFNTYAERGFTYAQHHSNPDSLNFTFVRTRGTSTTPTAVQDGDDIADLTFVGHDGTALAVAAQISCQVDGAVSTGINRGRIIFVVHKGLVSGNAGLGRVAEIDSNGVWKVDSLRSVTANADLNILNNGTGLVRLPAGTTVGGVAIGSLVIKGTVANNTALLAISAPSLGDTYLVLSPSPTHLWAYNASATWVDLGEFQGPTGQGVPTAGTIGQVLVKNSSTNYDTSWATLPTVPSTLTDLGITDGTSGQVLTTDGSGVFTFSSVTGSSSFTTISVAGQSDVVADTATDTLTLVAGSGITLTTNASTDTITIANSASATNSFTTVAVAGQSDVVADSATDTLTLVAGTGITLSTNATTDTITVTNSVTNTDTTYSIKATTAAGGATLDLDAGGSGSGTDSVTFAGGAGISVSRTDANTITVASSVTDTNTTYSINAVDGTTGKKIIRLTAGGSGSGDDDVTLVAGTNITLERTGDEITIASTASGGGSMATRTTASSTTASIANGATGNIAITGFKSYALLKMVVEHEAWVRIYTDAASRTADASRAEGVDPTPGSGVIAEVITTAAPQTILISPGTIGFNNESTPTTSIPIAVTNKSGTTRTITVTLTVLQLEA
jgi:hypothetical protein